MQSVMAHSFWAFMEITAMHSMMAQLWHSWQLQKCIPWWCTAFGIHGSYRNAFHEGTQLLAFTAITVMHPMMAHSFWHSWQLQKCIPWWHTAFGIHGNYRNAFHDGTQLLAFTAITVMRSNKSTQLLAFTAITVMHPMTAHSFWHSW